MKNQHILPNTRVPKETRLEVYKEALEIINKIIENEENEKEFKHLGAGLCLMLPCLLWGLDHFLDNFTTIDNKELPWSPWETSDMFIELNEDSIDFIERGNNNKEFYLKRQKVLIGFIKELEN